MVGLILGILFVTCLVTQAQEDIFKKHGVTKEPLTLSKGKYKETFYNEEVMQVGTVLINTLTNKVVKFLEEDTTKLAYKAETTSRFLTVDPLAEEYYSWSPYVYVKNNPMKFIDPDGRKLVIANNPERAMTNLAKMAATSLGGQIVSSLIGRNETYTLNSVFLSTSSNYDNSSRTINYVGNAYRRTVEGGTFNSMIAMGHETMHGYDHSINFGGAFKSNEHIEAAKGPLEGRAVSFANYLRETYSLGSNRNSYGGFKENFHQFTTGGTEKISDFTSLGNNANKTAYGFSYTKTISQNQKDRFGFTTGSKVVSKNTYYIIVGMDKDKNVTFKIYDNEDEYKKGGENW